MKQFYFNQIAVALKDFLVWFGMPSEIIHVVLREPVFDLNTCHRFQRHHSAHLSICNELELFIETNSRQNGFSFFYKGENTDWHMQEIVVEDDPTGELFLEQLARFARSCQLRKTVIDYDVPVSDMLMDVIERTLLTMRDKQEGYNHPLQTEL